MNNNIEQKTLSEEEIKNMSYWQLWPYRKTAGIFYFWILLASYSFLLYAFFKIIYIFAKSDSLEFHVDLWAIPIFLLAGPIYYYFHEFYYNKIYLKRKS